jgi:signal transduction histidine kinase
MQQFVGISLKTRLYLLILVAFIPVVVLIFFVAEEQKTIETQAILQKATLLAQATADAENQQVESTRNLLLSMVDTFQLVDGQPERLSGLLANMLSDSRGYVEFGIVAPDGRLLAGSDMSTMVHDVGDQPWFKANLEKKHLAMGQYRGEHINGEPVLYFARPALDSHRKIVAVAFAALNLNWMNRTIFRQLGELPKGSGLTLLDETREMIRYDVDSEGWIVPQSLDPLLQQQVIDHSPGTFVGTDETGNPRIYAFAGLESAFRHRRVTIVLDIPERVALAGSKRIFVRNLTFLVISALMAVLSIWWATDVFILRRVGAMVKASRRLAGGDLRTRIGRIGVRDELSHLAGVFDEMAASLQVRIEREEQVMASLERSREQLRRLSVYQNEVREQERIRIAREIHDQLGQSLTILKMDLSWIKKHRSRVDSTMDEKMDGMSQVIEEAMENLHAVTAELRPVMLDDFGLAAAIEWQAEAFTRRSGIACRLENNGFEPDLPREQATALFRIFQEILTNILRHAEADSVVVHLEKRDRDLLFQVADNGRGITENQINAPDAFGLLGIRERLYPFGGRVAFDGRPGQGTRVTIHLPMPDEGENS